MKKSHPVESNEPMTLQMRAEGKIVVTNLPEFAEFLRNGLATVNMTLSTDDDFIDAEAVVKNLSGAEAAIQDVKDKMLRDCEAIYEALTEMDALCAETAKVRLALTRQITKRKEEVRAELLAAATATLACAERMRPTFSRSLTEAMKGKKNLDSIKKSLDVMVACHNAQIRRSRGKIDAFIEQHGASMVMDIVELEVKAPDLVESELARRLEAHRHEQERKALQEQAAQARAETAIAARAHAASVAPAPPPADRGEIGSDRLVHAPAMSFGPGRQATHNGPPSRPNSSPTPPVATAPPQTPVAEWKWFFGQLAAAFAPIKEAKAKLTTGKAIRAAEIFTDGVNAAAKAAREEINK